MQNSGFTLFALAGTLFNTSGFKIALRANIGRFAKKFLAKRSVKIGTV
jgi:hypothetical protein